MRTDIAEQITIGPEKTADPATLKKSPLNIHDPLSREEYRRLKSSVEKHGQTRPALLWQGEVIAGWNISRILKDLGAQVIVREIADNTDRERVEDLCDQDNFAGRQNDTERIKKVIYARYGKLIMMDGRGGDTTGGTVLDRSTGRYTNKARYIAGRTGLTEGQVKRAMAEIKKEHGASRYTYRELSPDEFRTAKKWFDEYRKLNDKANGLRKALSEFPGGFARIEQEFTPRKKSRHGE